MPRRILITMLIGLIALGAVPLGVAAARHEVSGKGRVDAGGATVLFAFGARGRSTRANGVVRLTQVFPGDAGVANEGRVTCLTVRGRRMVIGGDVTAGPAAGTYFLVRGEDNGRDRLNPKDAISWEFGRDLPVACADFDLGGDLDWNPLARGDIAID